MLPDRVSNPMPLTYESDALPIALRGPAAMLETICIPYIVRAARKNVLVRQTTHKTID